jgi:putrescine:ornithine antiporter
MAAYAEDAYGKAGYFQVFYLYFVSVAIANVAVAGSAVGYLAAFVPWLSSTSTTTCIGMIAVLWLTMVANFGGPRVTGRLGAIAIWGVILPVGLLSIIGWFWFDPSTFAAAWNPKGLTPIGGMTSSITLTLWAFLGMESAAQNSAAVEDPKRNVPLACLLGTLGAAVIYILSTTVIQGIVPNADLAKSAGPFGLVYTRMFGPTVGLIAMALAVMACLGSLLGWQFTLAQTGKSAADDGMFPRVFGEATRSGAPIAGMTIMAVAQSLTALMTISPTLSEQFNALVNLAVVTNVIPYIIALSALPAMMRAARVGEPTFRRNVAVALVAMLYSAYAIYASGKDAVFGGMLVTGLGFVIWGFVASRFASGSRVRLPQAA